MSGLYWSRVVCSEESEGLMDVGVGDWLPRYCVTADLSVCEPCQSIIPDPHHDEAIDPSAGWIP